MRLIASVCVGECAVGSRRRPIAATVARAPCASTGAQPHLAHLVAPGRTWSLLPEHPEHAAHNGGGGDDLSNPEREAPPHHVHPRPGKNVATSTRSLLISSFSSTRRLLMSCFSSIRRPLAPLRISSRSAAVLTRPSSRSAAARSRISSRSRASPSRSRRAAHFPARASRRGARSLPRSAAVQSAREPPPSRCPSIPDVRFRETSSPVVASGPSRACRAADTSSTSIASSFRPRDDDAIVPRKSKQACPSDASASLELR